MAGTSAGAKKAAATRRARKFLAAKHGGYLPGPKTRKKAPAKKGAAAAAAAPAKSRKSKSGYDEWRTELHKLQEALSHQPPDFRFTAAQYRLDKHIDRHRNYAARLTREIKAGTAKVFGE